MDNKDAQLSGGNLMFSDRMRKRLSSKRHLRMSGKDWIKIKKPDGMGVPEPPVMKW